MKTAYDYLTEMFSIIRPGITHDGLVIGMLANDKDTWYIASKPLPHPLTPESVLSTCARGSELLAAWGKKNPEAFAKCHLLVAKARLLGATVHEWPPL